MRFNDYIDLVQLSEGEYNDTYGYDKKVPIVIAKNLPANFTSMADAVKLLQNRDIEWHERYIVQHKALMFSEVIVDAIYRHSDQKYYMVNWRHTTGTPKIISYRAEIKGVREGEWAEDGINILGDD